MFTCTSTIIELRRRGGGIVAFAYRGGRRKRAIRLPDGAIVEAPEPDRRREAPDEPGPFIGVAFDGSPAGMHHVNLGLVAGFLPLTGVFLLPDGEVAVVYGAEAVAIG